MKTILLLLSLALALPAFAGEAERMKLAEELLLAMKFDRNMEASLAAARQMQIAQLRNSGLSQLDAAAATEVRERTMELMQKELSWAKLKDQFIAAWAETMTEDELKAMVAFYRSPAGQAYVEKVPQLMKKSSEITQQRNIEVINPRIQQIVKEVTEQQKALAPFGAMKPKPGPGKSASPVQ